MNRFKSAFVALAGLVFGSLHALALPNLFISDGDNVDVFNGSSLNTSFISMNGASGLAVGVDGTLYAASINDAQVYSYNPNTGALNDTFVPFQGSTDSRSVQGPTGMTWGPDGNLYVADITGGNIHVYNISGTSVASLGGTSLGQPVNVAFDHSGQLYAVDESGIERYNGSLFTPYIQSQSGGGSYVLNIPASLGFSTAGDAYILDVSGTSPSILKFTGTTFDSEVIDFNTTNFEPSELVVGPDNKLYVSGINFDTGFGEVRDYNLDGSGESVYVTGLNNPTYMAFEVPEPSTNFLLFCGLGLVAIGHSRLRRRAA